jgi:hypothetical protein
LKHLLGLDARIIALLLSLPIIPACSSGKQSNQTTAPAGSPPPSAVSSNASTEGAAGTSFRKWKNAQIIAAFKAAGLEAENPRPMSKPQDYGQMPAIDVEGTQFNIPSAGEDALGHIYSFASEGDLEKMVAYYANASADNFSWVYVKDNILAQIDGRLEEDKAKKYEAAIGDVK